mgnify:CR=1 FL=1
MKKQLTLAGNSWQLYINKPLAKLLGINEKEFRVLIKIENKTLSVIKVTNEAQCANFLVKKLIKRGAGFGLNLTIPVIELLEINPEVDFLDINIENDKLIIRKSDKKNEL